jgi:predicted Na+-dependent transporter
VFAAWRVPLLQVLQYSVLPLIGFMISRHWGLSSSLAIGVALVRV